LLIFTYCLIQNAEADPVAAPDALPAPDPEPKPDAQVSISATFYEQLFVQKRFAQFLSTYSSAFVIFW
jgi:hypothetical protein